MNTRMGAVAILAGVFLTLSLACGSKDDAIDTSESPVTAGEAASAPATESPTPSEPAPPKSASSPAPKKEPLPIPEGLKALLGELNSKDAQDRRVALQKVWDLGESALPLLPRLLEMLEDEK
ncbi:MAG: hypothetical protein ACYS47_15785, partial [Planctomycetota bacterium]